MPSERPTAPPLPTAWQDAPAGAETNIASWWDGFHDPLLSSLVRQGLEQGPDVRLAMLRVKEARALGRTTVAAYLPSIDGTATGSYTNVTDPPGGSDTMTGSYGASVSWEIPLFARAEAAVRGARANNQSALADVRAAQATLAADIAQAYVDLRAARESYIALDEQVQAATQLAEILETGVRAGFTSESDAADARRLAESSRARLPDLIIQQRQAENKLAILRGIAPGMETAEVKASLAAAQDVPSLPLTQAPAAPADLLRLRPDVARAEAQATLAAADLAIARIDMWPSLNLTGAITASDDLIGNTLGGRGVTVTATPLISIPLFDWGTHLAARGQKYARFEQTLVQYQQTVLGAVSEASGALTSLDQGSKRLVSARAAETAAGRTAQGARAAYGAGIQSLADRLRADQQLIDTRLTRISAEASQASAAISVYRAFGGGF